MMGIGCILPNALDSVQTFSPHHECSICIFQREGSVRNIVYRTITGAYNGPEEETFGHCFFCLRCSGIQENPCFGWWPSDPDGGDFEGDDGSLHPDAKENWHTAQCYTISQTTAENVMLSMDSYEEKQRYHVLNWGGKSCLGFCGDVLAQTQTAFHLPFGNATIAGDLQIHSPLHIVYNTDNTSPADFMFSIHPFQNHHSTGIFWNQNFFQSMHDAQP